MYCSSAMRCGRCSLNAIGLLGHGRKGDGVCRSYLRASARSKSTLESEVAKFAKLGADWWDSKSRGGAGPLHSFNPVRVGFLRDCVVAARVEAPPERGDATRPLGGLAVLDVGCGGGLLSEALARLGGEVTGIDPGPENIAAAAAHAQYDPLTRNIHYRAGRVEDLLRSAPAASGSDAVISGARAATGAATGAAAAGVESSGGESSSTRYDVVVSSEVIEHVDSPLEFVAAMVALLRPGGVLCLSTINRTPKSFAKAIVGAEYLARLVPVGTHAWSKFVTPAEMDAFVAAADPRMRLMRRSGVVYNPFRDRWWLAADESVNYIACYAKPRPSLATSGAAGCDD